MNTPNNMQDMLAYLNNHTLPELISEAQADPAQFFGEIKPEELQTLVYAAVAEDFELGVAGRDEFALLEKALFLGNNYINQSEDVVRMAAILHNNELLFSAEGKINPDMAPGYFGELTQKCLKITEKVKAVLPDTNAAKIILQEEGAAIDLFLTANSALQFMSVTFVGYPLLTGNVKARIDVAGTWVKELADDFGSHEKFADVFFEYYDFCYETLEQFTALPSEIARAEALQSFKKIAANYSSLCTDDVIDFLTNNHILAIHEVLNSSDCPELEEEQLDYLALIAATGSKQLLNNGGDMDEVMDFAEKALLLACDDTLVATVLLQIALLLGTVEDLDFDEDEINLALIPGRLVKSALPYTVLYDVLEEDDPLKWTELWTGVGAYGGISNVIDKAYSFRLLFETLTDKYNDYSDAIDEDTVETALDGWNIETEDDPEDFIASIYEYYDDFSYKMQMLESPLSKMKDYRNFNV